MDLSLVLERPPSRRALTFMAIGLTVWLVEISFALWLHNLGLIMYALLTIFRVMCVAVSLCGVALSRTKRTLSYSYGFGRLETLVGFSSCVLVVFASGYVFLEAIFEISFEPAHPERHPSPGVIPFAIVGLFVDICALFFFSKEVQPHIESVRSARKLDFVFSYVMDDLLCCSAVVLASWISSWGSVFVAEPLSALICGFLVLRAVRPYATGFARVLLQASPHTLQTDLDTRLREAATIPGVLELRDEHFWTHTPGVFVGSLKVRAASEADTQAVLAAVHRLLSPLITHLTVHIEKQSFTAVTTVK